MQAHNICTYISIYVRTRMYAYMHSKEHTAIWNIHCWIFSHEIVLVKIFLSSRVADKTF